MSQCEQARSQKGKARSLSIACFSVAVKVTTWIQQMQHTAVCTSNANLRANPMCCAPGNSDSLVIRAEFVTVKSRTCTRDRPSQRKIESLHQLRAIIDSSAVDSGAHRLDSQDVAEKQGRGRHRWTVWMHSSYHTVNPGQQLMLTNRHTVQSRPTNWSIDNNVSIWGCGFLRHARGLFEQFGKRQWNHSARGLDAMFVATGHASLQQAAHMFFQTLHAWRPPQRHDENCLKSLQLALVPSR